MKKSMLTKTLVWICLIMILLVSDAFAGPRDHDGGFFLRLSTGVGAAQSAYADSQVKMSGVSTNTNLAIGACILPNLAVHGTLFGWLMPNPEAEIFGINGPFNGTFMLAGFGGGLTYYIMPINIYLSPSIGVGSLTLESGGVSASSDMGLAFDMAMGKEFWVGGSWGLGVAGSFGYHSVPDQGANWSGYDFSVMFSATLN